jgi:hypothetical protein
MLGDSGSIPRGGFDIEATYGTWMRTPFDDTCPLIILIARAL